MPEISELRGEAAGVPYVALPPDPAVDEAPTVSCSPSRKDSSSSG